MAINKKHIYKGDYVLYSTKIRLNYNDCEEYKVIDYTKNTMKQTIMILESLKDKNVISVHPSYLILSDRGVRKRKLEKLN